MSSPIKPFIVLRTWAGNNMGTTHEYHQLVKCPDCGEEFVQDISEGCFHHRTSPDSCPKCRYPWTLIEKERERVYGQKKEPPFNPSQRLK